MYPLSFAQRRLWFISEFEGPSSAYNTPIVTRFRGPLNPVALKAALYDVVVRHEPLRTIFTLRDSEPRQCVVDESAVELNFEASAPSAAHLDSAIADAVRHVFDLTCEIPVRARLFQIGPDEHILVLLIHHIAFDGWSLEPLSRDLALAYAARDRGRPPDWEELPVRYRDYAIWQQELLADGTGPTAFARAQLGYWRSKLAGLPEEITLPADRPRAGASQLRGPDFHARIHDSAHTRLLELAAECNVSMFMICQALVSVLLCRMGAGEDIPLGTPVAGRTDETLDDLVGFFVNTLVLRTDVAGNPSFRTLLRRVRSCDLEAYENADIPFEQVVEELNPERDQFRHPLFQTMLTFEEDSGAPLRLPGLTAEPVSVQLSTAKFDLSLEFVGRRTAVGTPGGIEITWQYATDRFDQETIVGLSMRLLRLAESFAQDADTAILDVDILDPREREQLIRGWNDTDVPVLPEPLPRLFDAQVAATPDAIALIGEGIQLSYAQLAARAEQVAGVLNERGIGAEDLVAVCLPRTPELIIGLLGVLKSGAAYLPVDPVYPDERIGYMLDDSRPSCALTVAETTNRIPDRIPVLRVDMLPQEPSPRPDQARDRAHGRQAHPAHPAYVIYTSGSTGRPKGTVITHGALSIQVQWLRACFEATSNDQMIQFASTSFDSHVEDTYPMLVSGGSLITLRDPAVRLPELLRGPLSRSITILGLPTAYWHELVAAGDDTPWPRNLRLANVGGERMSRELVSRWRALVGEGVRLLNSYGPTETTVNATAGFVTRLDSDNLSIGRPVWRTRAYILDARLQPVPAGVPGELYVAGPQLARGYLGRSALTASRFVPCPWGERPGERMYRTGDVARWTREGEIEFLGRADDQVKIRGFRVELREVEAALARLDGVGQCAVVVREENPGDRRLVSYIVARGRSRIDSSTVRAAAAKVLPRHLVPSHCVILDALPLTPNGKLDKKALPAPGPEFRLARGRPPRDERERILCGLFAAVLGTADPSVDDDFFDSGGHSLLATRLAARIRALLGAGIGVRDIFECPTVAKLAQRITVTADAQEAHAVIPRDRPARPPLSSAQLRLWYTSLLGGQNTAYTIPLVTEFNGPLDARLLAAALLDVVLRHEPLRTLLREVDDEPYQEIVSDVCVDQLFNHVHAEAAETDGLLAHAVNHAFDLERELPLRAWLFSEGPDRHTLLLMVHHIAADGWSITPLYRDLRHAYEARLAGRDPEWKPLEVQYVDFALWQLDQLKEIGDTSSPLGAKLEYWRRQLAGLPAELPLPYDRARAPRASGRGARSSFSVDADSYEKLTALTRAEHVTVFMAVQAAVAVVLHLNGAGTDIPVGAPVAGRPDESLADLVGLFVNNLVLRSDLSGDPTLREVLDRVRAVVLAALDHQDVPFERLVAALHPPRNAARHPLFQTAVFYEVDPPTELDLPGVTSVERIAPTASNAAAKFDLGFTFNERRASPSGLDCTVAYDAGLFELRTIQRLIAHFSGVLDAMTNDCTQRLSKVMAGIGTLTPGTTSRG